jgi:hypothetical protein
MNLDHPLMPFALVFIVFPAIGLLTALVTIITGL